MARFKEPEQPRAVPDGKVRIRFTCSHTHTHCGLPFTAGDEILVDPHWADAIEAMGTGHRVPDLPTKE